MVAGLKAGNPAEFARPIPDFWNLVRNGEPYRLLFPLGTVLGICGVLLWPLFFWRIFATYPGQIHARVMIEAFLGCFVAGFLGTAVPHLLSTPALKPWQTATIALALCGVAILHAASLPLWGDVAFAAGMAVLCSALIARLLARNDTPPPSFVLVALGLLSALVGAVLQIVARLPGADFPFWVVRLGQLLLYQGFILLPAMGIGAFLLPRFVGLKSRQDFPESRLVPSGWTPRALFAGCCGLAILISFGLEAAGSFRWGYGLRAVAVLTFLLRELPLHRTRLIGGSLGLGLRLALISIPLGYALMALWPARAPALSHVVFISGFSLLTFIVASRVILGHSGQAARFATSIRSVLILVSMIVFAMFTRVTADWMPKVTMSHYAYAAIAWAMGVAVWGFCILPFVRVSEPE